MTERLLYAVRSAITYRPGQPTRDEAYRRFIRTFPCVVCQSRWTEAAHTGPHGLGQKSDDFSCIPLCREHHRTGQRSYHRLGRARFEFAHRIEIAALIGMFQGWWGER